MPGPQSTEMNKTVPALRTLVSSGVGPIVTETCTVYCGKLCYLILCSRGQLNVVHEKTEHNLDILKILKGMVLDIHTNVNNFPCYCKKLLNRK